MKSRILRQQFSYKPLKTYHFNTFPTQKASQVVLVVKTLPASAEDIRDKGLIPGLGRSPGGGHGNLLKYPCLENPMDRGAWCATAHRITQSQT